MFSILLVRQMADETFRHLFFEKLNDGDEQGFYFKNKGEVELYYTTEYLKPIWNEDYSELIGVDCV